MNRKFTIQSLSGYPHNLLLLLMYLLLFIYKGINLTYGQESEKAKGSEKSENVVDVYPDQLSKINQEIRREMLKAIKKGQDPLAAKVKVELKYAVLEERENQKRQIFKAKQDLQDFKEACQLVVEEITSKVKKDNRPYTIQELVRIQVAKELEKNGKADWDQFNKREYLAQELEGRIQEKTVGIKKFTIQTSKFLATDLVLIKSRTLPLSKSDLDEIEKTKNYLNTLQSEMVIHDQELMSELQKGPLLNLVQAEFPKSLMIKKMKELTEQIKANLESLTTKIQEINQQESAQLHQQKNEILKTLTANAKKENRSLTLTEIREWQILSSANSTSTAMANAQVDGVILDYQRKILSQKQTAPLMNAYFKVGNLLNKLQNDLSAKSLAKNSEKNSEKDNEKNQEKISQKEKDSDKQNVQQKAQTTTAVATTANSDSSLDSDSDSDYHSALGSESEKDEPISLGEYPQYLEQIKLNLNKIASLKKTEFALKVPTQKKDQPKDQQSDSDDDEDDLEGNLRWSDPVVQEINQNSSKLDKEFQETFQKIEKIYQGLLVQDRASSSLRLSLLEKSIKEELEDLNQRKLKYPVQWSLLDTAKKGLLNKLLQSLPGLTIDQANEYYATIDDLSKKNLSLSMDNLIKQYRLLKKAIRIRESTHSMQMLMKDEMKAVVDEAALILPHTKKKTIIDSLSLNPAVNPSARLYDWDYAEIRQLLQQASSQRKNLQSAVEDFQNKLSEKPKSNEPSKLTTGAKKVGNFASKAGTVVKTGIIGVIAVPLAVPGAIAWGIVKVGELAVDRWLIYKKQKVAHDSLKLPFKEKMKAFLKEVATRKEKGPELTPYEYYLHQHLLHYKTLKGYKDLKSNGDKIWDLVVKAADLDARRHIISDDLKEKIQEAEKMTSTGDLSETEKALYIQLLKDKLANLDKEVPAELTDFSLKKEVKELAAKTADSLKAKNNKKKNLLLLQDNYKSFSAVPTKDHTLQQKAFFKLFSQYQDASKAEGQLDLEKEDFEKILSDKMETLALEIEQQENLQKIELQFREADANQLQLTQLEDKVKKKKLAAMEKLNQDLNVLSRDIEHLQLQIHQLQGTLDLDSDPEIVQAKPLVDQASYHQVRELLSFYDFINDQKNLRKQRKKYTEETEAPAETVDQNCRIMSEVESMEKYHNYFTHLPETPNEDLDLREKCPGQGCNKKVQADYISNHSLQPGIPLTKRKIIEIPGENTHKFSHCSHLICKDCLEKLRVTTYGTDKYRCPTCQEKIPNDELNEEEWNKLYNYCYSNFHKLRIDK